MHYSCDYVRACIQQANENCLSWQSVRKQPYTCVHINHSIRVCGFVHYSVLDTSSWSSNVFHARLRFSTIKIGVDLCETVDIVGEGEESV